MKTCTVRYHNVDFRILRTIKSVQYTKIQLPIQNSKQKQSKQIEIEARHNSAFFIVFSKLMKYFSKKMNDGCQQHVLIYEWNKWYWYQNDFYFLALKVESTYVNGKQRTQDRHHLLKFPSPREVDIISSISVKN